MIILITGLSASGKTTIGRAIYKKWKQLAPETAMVDGDEIRDVLKMTSGDAYTRDGRHATAKRYCDQTYWLDRQDINVVCCSISFFEDLRQLNRDRLSKYFEVYVKAPMDVLQRRDTKNLYDRALAGKIDNVVGVDLILDPPKDPDMVIDNSIDNVDINAIAKSILTQAKVLK